MRPLQIAVIGAGIAGLACAGALRRRAVQVTLFEKSRGPGGRVATRLTEQGSFDHGAPYFTVHTHRFEHFVERWVAAGVVVRWPGRLIAFDRRRVIERPLAAERYVGAGGMHELGRHLATDLDIRYETQVARLERRNGQWNLYDDKRPLPMARGFDALVVTAPSPQTAQLLSDLSPLATIARSVEWESVWTAMVALSRPSGIDYDAALIYDDPILGWIGRDDSKPERASVTGVAERWVLHANPRWSRKYLELAPDAAAHWLGRAFSARVGRPVRVRALFGHRWRYATPIRPLKEDCLWDAQARVGVAGDWFGEPRVEGAFLSGLAMADALLAG